jgi:SAM-dependent methyltransferase
MPNKKPTKKPFPKKDVTSKNQKFAKNSHSRPGKKTPTDTKSSWNNVSSWYSKLVGNQGHFFHKEVILPKISPYLDFKKFEDPSFLDIGCGAGSILPKIPANIPYVGVDPARGMIDQAKKMCQDNPKNRHFHCLDATKKFNLSRKFSHCSMMLSLQNIENPEKVMVNVAAHTQLGGRLLITLNHPCFRIPRQTHWGVDDKKQQYRRVDRYLSPLSIPISMSPSQGKESPKTWSYHFPLSYYTKILHSHGFATLFMEEWTNPKTSTGGMAKTENRARQEIPMFLFLLAEKIRD